jgi:putative intracellular protease/amidase
MRSGASSARDTARRPARIASVSGGNRAWPDWSVIWPPCARCGGDNAGLPTGEAALKHRIPALLLTVLPSAGVLAQTPVAAAPLKDGMIKVAVVISDHANLMDIAGPWEVFQDAEVKDAHGNDISPYGLYTVAPSKAALHTAGSNHPGLDITPDYDFADAPMPDIVVVGAQSGGPGLSAWLRKIHAQHKVVMSVCTGAFKLGEAGLLNGKPATTHHWYFGNFASQFPDVKLVRQVRYVQADPITFTAGGLTSGVDLSLHMVAVRFGQDVAQKTADYMEYQGTGWKSNQGISELTTPVSRKDWTGMLAPHSRVALHLVVTGASNAITTDIPAQHVLGAPTTAKQNGDTSILTIDIAGHPATFTVHTKQPNDQMTGTFVQDGKSYPLTLMQAPDKAN